jgi:8-oxo-dGTP diphosphatase
VLRDTAGRVLVAQRPHGKELAGRWEFPGGKLHAGESPYAGLVRELREELGIDVRAAERLLRYPYAYPEKYVWLDVWTVTAWTGDVQSLDSQALQWVGVDALPTVDLLEADAPIVAALRNREPA